MTERALVFTDEREVSVRRVETPALAENEVRVDADVSAISSGTELLIYRDQAPAAMPAGAWSR